MFTWNSMRRCFFSRLLPAVLSVMVICSLRAEEPIVFGRDIRPLLSDRCFTCHGPDRHGWETELRLDSQSAAHKGAIVAGKSGESELIARVSSDDPDSVMPPSGSGKKPLTEKEIALLKRWIDEGGQYAEHWAYVPPVKGEAPAITAGHGFAEGVTANEIDAFTLDVMRQHGLVPSAMTDRRTLLRRLSFDLIGLPPTPEEVAAFEVDTTPDAYSKQVERLLASPHFGERMAVYWLDLVRYGDSAGYHSDKAREVDAYRTYVIHSFNENKPFDRFTVEQLAGDLLPDATDQTRVASGYNRLLQTTDEGGAQSKEYTAIYMADRVRNVSDVWLATTMGCCQCHDHKFDPLATREFYELGAFFADVAETAVGGQQPNLRLPTEEETAEIARLTQRIGDLKQAPIDNAKLTVWADGLRQQLGNSNEVWTPIRPSEVKSSGGQTLTTQDDLSVLASGKNPDKDDYSITLPLAFGDDGKESITGVRLEALLHESLTNGSLSRANGNFVLTGVSASLSHGDAELEPVLIPIKFKSAKADFSQQGWPVEKILDGNPATGWAGDGHNAKANRTAVLLLEDPITAEVDNDGKIEPVWLILTLQHRSPHAKHNIGRFRISLTTQTEPTISGGVDLPVDLTAILMVAPTQRTDTQTQQLMQQYRDISSDFEAARKEITDSEQKVKQINNSVKTMLVAQAINPRTVRVLPRGNWLDDSGDIVEPGVPATLGQLNIKDRRATRLDLAEWIVSRDNPVTARVYVNRIWSRFFGRGLATLEDVGRQGAWPTHPELLDWLAVDFMEQGWDTKRLIRQIVMSATYQQRSTATPDRRQRDPFNQYLARQGHFRLPAEFVRDNALAVSGLLVSDIGGPTVKPYQPPKYWQHLNFPQREWQSDSGQKQYRRGLYTFWCRSFLHPSMLAFDAVSREECTAQRPRSNTPLQALVLLNDPTYIEAARVLAANVATQPGDDSSRMTYAFGKVLQREPSAAEREVLDGLLTESRQRYLADASAAEQVQTNGLADKPGALPASEVAAWTTVTRVLLNLHETITRY